MPRTPDDEHAVGLLELKPDVDTPPADALKRWEPLFARLQARIPRTGSLWIFCRNGRHGGRLVAWPDLVARDLTARFGFLVKNALIRYVPAHQDDEGPFGQAYETILFLVKDLQAYRFDKTPIREPHVFKHLEWGKRGVGKSGYHENRTSLRYPDKGRDPGNVLYKDRRDAEGRILEILEYPKDLLCRNLLDMTSRPDETVLLQPDSPFADVVRASGRRIGLVEA